ncbi:Uncharacterized conserved protein YggE, contains kinase-interacting SIMPL domain [Muriicola jejuensis]|uniref:DUF541 domain-containing protein n=1 Tax=Muriicola jejuensis TaxID=504488 RepID=A0A6P0UAB4_9FLAO|nr:SIMPL domain-containing protein [Muriicola jejuensis]NER10155.1 DUF541 domain-containing protein [Muriicola jejuensis]SMP02626.1 Uncharacterized conserved protein YggE, contains kinase-interacting SIMPL domain [Muriicola jejuensis]
MRTLTILLAFLFIAGCRVGSTQIQNPPKTIMLKSVGEIETLPNMASFRANLSCVESTVLAAKECLVVKSNALTDQLKGFGIAPKDILTTNVELNKKYRWDNGEQVFIGYESSTSIVVTVRSMDSLPMIYSTLLENENLNLGGLSYSHSDINGLENKAYLDALSKANALADELLSQLPETEKAISRISNVTPEVSFPVNDMQRNSVMNLEMDMKQGGDIAVNTGTLKVRALLYVEYQIR